MRRGRGGGGSGVCGWAGGLPAAASRYGKRGSARAQGRSRLLQARSSDPNVKSIRTRGKEASGEGLTIAPRYCISSSRGRGGAGDRGPTAAGGLGVSLVNMLRPRGTPGSAPRWLEGAAAAGASLFSRSPSSVLFRPSPRPRPSFAWYFSTRLAGDESAALRRPAASRGRGRAGAAVLTPPLPSQACSLEGQYAAKDKRNPAPDAHFRSA